MSHTKVSINVPAWPVYIYTLVVYCSNTPRTVPDPSPTVVRGTECAQWSLWHTSAEVFKTEEKMSNKNGMLASSHVIAAAQMCPTAQIICWKLIVSVTVLSCMDFRRWLRPKGRDAMNEINGLINESQRSFLLSCLPLHETLKSVHHMELTVDSRTADLQKPWPWA